MNKLYRRMHLFVSYVVSCNGTSPSRVMFWIVVTAGLFMILWNAAGCDPFEGAWFFLNMTCPDETNILLSILAFVDGLLGVFLTAEFISVCNNNRW